MAELESIFYERPTYDNKLRRMNMPNHPFNKQFSADVKKATEAAKKRAQTNKKHIPSHIVLKQDEYGLWGMWNKRLEIWCMGEEKLIPPTFQSQKMALEWYKSQI